LERRRASCAAEIIYGTLRRKERRFSREALEAYAEEYGEEIPLSTVSTYLARLTERGFLERVKGQGFIRYRLARSSEIQE